MTVRTSMEARSRIELTFSFDSEEEANTWVAMFKAATECYAAQEAKKGDSSKANRPVSQPPRGGNLGSKAKAKRLKK